MPTPLLENRQLGRDTARANLLTNGGFEVWQRGNTFNAVGSGVRTADTWYTSVAAGAAANVYRDTGLATPQSAASTWRLQVDMTAFPGGAVFSINQRVEVLAARRYTLSMWVFSQVANHPAIACETGAGGALSNTASSGAHLGGGWQWMWWSGDLPAGQTIIIPRIFAMSNNPFALDSAMLVAGGQPADYAPMHPADELERCQRYYEIHFGGFLSGWSGGTGSSVTQIVSWRTTKASVPTLTVGNTWALGAFSAQPGVSDANTSAFTLGFTTTGAGNVWVSSGGALSNAIRGEANV